MSIENSTIFDSNKFRLYIPYRKLIVLENFLNENNIEYWSDLEMPNSLSDLVRIYFHKKDEKEIEDILKKLQIQASDDFHVPSDYEQNKKIQILYFKFFGILLALVLIIYFIREITQ